MILGPALLLAMAAKCVAVAPGPKTIAAEAIKESGGQPLAIHDNTTSRTVIAGSPDDFLRIAEAGITAGHSLDLGLMQINSGNLRWLRLSISDAANPCRSMQAGAEVLRAESGYNTGSPTRGLAYAEQVNAIARGIGGAIPRVSSASSSPGIVDSWHDAFGKATEKDEWDQN